jgi:hypothetical protein
MYKKAKEKYPDKRINHKELKYDCTKFKNLYNRLVSQMLETKPKRKKSLVRKFPPS